MSVARRSRAGAIRNIVAALRACQKRVVAARELVIAVAVAACACGCTTPLGPSPPSVRFDARARALGFERVDVAAGEYRVALFRRSGEPRSSRLHVYLEGDGTPWLRGSDVAADPTPRLPFALELAARDRSEVVLLGRPCYHGHARDARCGPEAWTSARYGEEILAGLAVALAAAAEGRAAVTLVGYSGGGVLARLLAERVRVARVVTVAANLDVAAWAHVHGYQPLDESLDPALRPPLVGIDEVDLVGTRDTTVPPSTLDAYAARNPDARFVRFPDYDHRCCWIDAWPTLLAQLVASQNE